MIAQCRTTPTTEMRVRSPRCNAGCGWIRGLQLRGHDIPEQDPLPSRASSTGSSAEDLSVIPSPITPHATASAAAFILADDAGDALAALLGPCRSRCKLSPAQRLEWLRSHILGHQVRFLTPFGPRQALYLDHTASGRSLLFIEEFVLHHVLPFYGNTHTEDSFVGQRISSMVCRSAQYIKEQLGGTRSDALLFCGSGCTGAIKRLQEVMAISIPSTLRSRMLEVLGEQERWVVFLGPYEHHSNLLSWRQSLAEVVQIPAGDRGSIDLQALETALQAPKYSRRPKLGSFSACSNVTGLISDTRALARILHKHGAFACFDFAASAPHVPIDIRSSKDDGYDAVVLSAHKFLGGPGTPGILLMSKTLYVLGKCPPSTCGGGTVSYVNGFNEEDTLYCKRIEERENGGTPPIIQTIRCALAFWVKDFIGSTVIVHHESLFMKKALKRLSSNPNIEILGNIAAKRAPILSFIIYTTERETRLEEGPSNIWKASMLKPPGATIQGKPLHGRFVVKLLNDLFGIQARGGCACAGPYGHTLLGVGQKQSLAIRSAIKEGYLGLKPGWTRLSFSYDMTDEEVEYVLAAIEMVAKYGQRYLPLYDFDWKTGDWNYRHGNGLGSNSDHPPSAHHSQHHMFCHWLDHAKTIARRLPKIPPPRSMPDDHRLDPDLLLFRV